MARLLAFGTFLALVALLLHFRYVRATSMPRPWSVISDAVLIVMWLLALVGIGSGELFDPAWARVPAFIGLSWLAVVLYLVLGTALIGLVTITIRLVAAASGRDSKALRARVTRIGSAVVAAVSVLAVGYGVFEAANPRVTHTTVALDRLPAAFDGVRVALVSDLHVGPARGEGFVRKVVDQVSEQSPDMIILDGDLIDGTVDLVGSDLAPLRDLSAPLGVFAVSGNHEFYADDGGKWLDLWESLGITVLRNSHETVTKPGGSSEFESSGAESSGVESSGVESSGITVAGINDATAPEPYEPDLTAALAGRNEDSFVLLLAHQPLQAFEASDMGVDFQVSGHTHAGQIWPLRYLVPLQQPSVEGLDTVGDTTLYTTRGAGAWGPPVRVAAPPEIALLELSAP